MKRPNYELPPEPWSYNPSKWSQRFRVAIVGVFAFLIAVYLGLYQWGIISSVWDPIFGDQSMQVLNSSTSHWMSRIFRIPDGVMGAWAYLGDVVFALAGSVRRWQFRPWLVIIFGLDVIPLGIVSIILVIAQGFIVKAWCFLCLVTALISLILIILAYDEVVSCIIFLYRVWKRSKDVKLLWKTCWGYPSKISHEVGLELTKKGRKHVGKNR
ncbi:MAG: vitamin K epoxide reductase [Chlamydiae bacterium CG10_big_fil_rev_8_21_14_0_10_35_9]|nr:MAG: vitamin K epoxide reductase [Chlamydiae bacterium CG10_big_fil_rev_8_21_14_0_10_35_9]